LISADGTTPGALVDVSDNGIVRVDGDVLDRDLLLPCSSMPCPVLLGPD